MSNLVLSNQGMSSNMSLSNKSNITKSSSYSSFDECPVCFIEKYADHASRLKCGHKLCSECLANHAIASSQKNNQIVDCPLCRSKIVEIIPRLNQVAVNIETLPPAINEYDYSDRNSHNNKSLYCCIAIMLLFIVPYLLMKFLEDLAHININDINMQQQQMHP